VRNSLSVAGTPYLRTSKKKEISIRDVRREA
jgi:hypothetical protein